MLEMRESPEKGLGLFATRAILRGERLIQEKALISLTGYEDFTPVWWKHLYLKFENLSPEDQAKYLDLSYIPRQFLPVWDRMVEFLRSEGLSSEDLDAKFNFLIKLMSIWYVNNAEILLPNELHGSGVFLTYTRINHSCVPNTNWNFDGGSMTMWVTAIQDIAEDEEITISYTIAQLPHRTRAAQLEHYGFECRCEACDGPDKEASNERRERMVELDMLFEVYAGNVKIDDSTLPADRRIKDHSAAAEFASEYIDLLIAERLLGSELVRGYDRLKYYRILLGDHESALKAGLMAAEYRAMFLDPLPEHTSDC
ncbi:hypothetical protein GGR53DRAFT_466561 [Hypoxylon sp. FL1150]|nr:hypothetical protein GGR53DRAFT_466561 [Hypoxylon sp. FL1150]